MVEASFQIKGLEELKKRLEALPKELQDKPFKASLRAAGKVLQQEIVASAPFDGETPDGVHINENIQVGRSRSKSGPGVETFTVGVRYGKSEYKNTALNRRLKRVGRKFKTEGAAWYWKLIEFGTSRIAKQPFIRPALQRSRRAMVEAFTKTLAKGIARMEKRK